MAGRLTREEHDARIATCLRLAATGQLTVENIQRELGITSCRARIWQRKGRAARVAQLEQRTILGAAVGAATVARKILSEMHHAT